MRLSAFSALCIGAVLASACTDQGTAVFITIGATAMVPTTTLHLEATAQGNKRTFDVAAPNATIPPEASILLQVPKSVTGSIDLLVEARDGAGHAVASTTKSTVLSPGKIVAITMTLEGDKPDGSVPGVDLVGVDFAGLDLVGVDLAMPMPDLALADLVEVPPDLCPATFTMVPTSHDYLAHNAGESVVAFDFKMQNNGCSTTGIVAAATITGTDAAQFTIDTDNCKDFAYAVGANPCTVSVSFHPTGAGARVATLQITDGVRTGTATLVGKSLGAASAACSSGDECQSTHCTDGVCCDKDATQCTDCYACNVASKEGTCSPVPADTDPKSACASHACSNTCDGAGACKPFAKDTACSAPSTTCSNTGTSFGQVVSAGFVDAVCPGNGLECTGTKTRPCSGSTCNGSMCRATCGTDFDCLVGYYCDTAGDSTCKPRKAAGGSCNRVRQCVSGACEAGICQSGCYQSTHEGPPWGSGAWGSPYPWPCVLGGGGVNAIASGCASGPQCTASGLGSVCESNSNCACTGDGECTNLAAPRCYSGQTYPANGARCACYSLTIGSSHEPIRCNYGQKCVLTASTTTENNIYADACKTIAGFPCNAGSECASGVCTGGNCQ